MKTRNILFGAAVIVATFGAVILLRPSPPPNVILITVDTLRRDHVSCYPGARARTPAIDAVAASGVRFDAAEAACPLTLPSHASMLTGLDPCRHGLRDNLGHALPPRESRGFDTLPEILSDAGYDTAAFVSGATLDASYGLDAGFDVYSDPDRPEARGAVHLAERRGQETTDAVAAWLDDREDGRPLFLWVHYFDPHAPYDAPYPHDGGETDAERYAGEVAYSDEQVGRLLRDLETRGLLEDAVVLILSDHGEGLGQHGERTHGHLLHETTLAIPFVLRAPGVPAGEVIEPVVRTTDLLPTILALLGHPPAGDVDGEDLAPLWSGETVGPPSAYAESLYSYRECGWAQQSSLRAGRLKLIDTGPRRQLFDLETDPGETTDIAAQLPERVEAMYAVLRRTREQATPTARTDATAVLPAGAYGVAGDPGRTAHFLPAAANAKLPAPIDRMHVVAKLDRARTLYEQGADREAIGILDGLVPLESANPSLRFWRALVLRRAGRYAEAADDAARAMALGSKDVRTRDLRLNALALSGRHEEVDRVFAEFSGILPATADTHLALAASCMARRLHAKALEHLRIALEKAPETGRPRDQAHQGLRLLSVEAPEPVRTEARRLLEGASNGR
jgi:arylsulfatase A-like enzyme